ncbi:penicillin binding protein PBP4B [Pseudoflavonifractor capillosus]|uniref:penicillin binding protein PBP4B n=1 Tax=Pseudoflavonifractor capillosus TaxID=106588 RepID=UPI0023F75B59|nr:penicillin binding protein PBP4B [Pseudoflavonifractor capillosus]MDY4661532.1 penicillin binding protein PBP4B [Pseudoflavonifractor capillosus]
MRSMLKKATGLILAAALTFSLAAPAAAAGSSRTPGSSATATAVTEVTLPQQGWQAQVTFPDWAGYVDDTLAMNSLYSFDGYVDQGELYVTLAKDVTSLRLFVNNAEVDTSAMKGGSTYKVDISDLTVNGTNTVQVSAITPSTLEGAVTVSIPYPTVIEGVPSDVGMSEEVLGVIDDFIASEVKYGFSGAQLAVVKDGKMVYSNAWGAVNGYNPDGTRIEEGDENYVPVTTDTLYDLASNTKMYSVNYALQYMLTQGTDVYDISLDDPITKFFPEFDDEGKTIFKEGTSAEDQAQILQWKSELTVRDILMHQAGFDPDPQYHNDQFNQVTQKPEQGVDNPLFSQDRETTLTKVLASPLTYEPGTKTVYSDVDYMLLCFIIEKVTGKGLDVFLKETFWDPMGLTHITYNPLQNGFEKNDCAATELNGNTRDGVIRFKNVRTETVQGEVHDEKAYYAMGGVSGHAGLFSNAEDLAKLASVMLTGGYGGNQFFSKNIMDEFTKPKSLNYPTWGLGWWRQAELGRSSYFSIQSSNSTIGHQGWTGTLTVIDPENDLVVVLLTNKKNSPVIDPNVAANDFYSDNMVLGGLGSVVGLVYDSMRSSVDAVDAVALQMANDRIRLMMSHKNAYDEAPHMNDAYALVDLVVAIAEQRKSDVTKANAQLALKNINDFVEIYVAKEENLVNAAAWSAQLQARIDAIVTDGSAPAAPAAPGLTAEYRTTVDNVSSLENCPFNGGDQNYVYFPRPYSSTGSTSTVYYNTGTWFDGYEGQGTLWLWLGKELTVDGGIRIFVNGVEVDNSNLVGQTGIFSIDISGVARNGRNSIQVTIPNINETARTKTRVAIANPTVVDKTDDASALASVGLDAKALDLIDSVVQNDIDNGFTSAQLAIIKDGQMVYSNAWGTVNAYNPDGTPKTDSPAVTTDTLYDLASNTKMYATNYAIQYLVANSKNYNNFSINAPITKYFPDFVNNTIEIKYETSNGTGAPDLETAKAWKAELTVADILQHQAGFAPDPQFHNDKFNQVTQKPDPDTDNVLYAIGKDKVAEAICKAPLVYEPGTKTVYSDVDYMLLGLIIEQVTGKDLNTFLKETFWQPMGLDHITYNPLNNGFTANDCAATELNGNSRDGAISFTGNRTGTIQGQVHDEKAWYAMGGVSGHAGLFANAEDLATLAQMMLNPSGYGTNRLFSTNVNEYFTSRKNSSATWGQGWWRQADCGRPWYFGVQASRNTIGHQGWTGTLTAIDPEQDLVVVYLTNKINSPVTDNTVNANQFDGNWYTASTLGFVTNILYQGITANSAADDIQPALDALLGDMAVDKLRLVADEKTDDPTHPIVRSAYSVVDLVFDAAEARRTSDNIAAARAALSGLDAARDAAVYSSYQDRLTVLEPPATTPDYNNPSDEKPEWENPYSDVSDSYWAYDAIRFVSEENLFQGVTGGGFAPEMTMSRAMLATVLYRAAGSPAVTASAGFTDVPAGKWYSDAVNWAASKGIVKGVGGNRFAPDDNVSREQIATILYQYVLSTGETAKADASVLAVYGDNASVSSWAADGMAWAVKEGIITGKPGSLLAPADSATRAEVATMLMRFLGK